MRIARAAARNLKGFADFDETFGEVNVISGRNGLGKSSVLDLISAAFVTEGARNLLTTGAEDGWLLVILEGDGETIEIRRTLSLGKVSEPTIKSSRTGKVTAYAKFIKEMVDTATLDPIRKVMTASPKEQTAILLETMPLTLDHTEIASAINGMAPLPGLAEVVNNAKKLPALDAIKSVSDFIYKERTGINRDSKTKRTHAQELRSSLGPAGDEGNWQEKAASLLQQLQDLAGQQARDTQQAESDYGDFKQTLVKDSEAARSAVDRDIDAKIASLNRERAARKALVDSDEKSNLDKLHVAHQDNLQAIESQFRPERDRLTAEHAMAQQNASQQERVKQTITIANQNDHEAEALEARSKSITKTLERLDGLREGLLQKLPIKGLKIEGGRAYLNGVPLEEVNTAERGKFWVRVAVMRAASKELGTVLIDDAEHFDDVNFPVLLEACKNSGLQFFISKVEPHPFRIEKVA
jgi:hypothetical protein